MTKFQICCHGLCDLDMAYVEVYIQCIIYIIYYKSLFQTQVHNVDIGEVGACPHS